MLNSALDVWQIRLEARTNSTYFPVQPAYVAVSTAVKAVAKALTYRVSAGTTFRVASATRLGPLETSTAAVRPAI